VRPSYGLTDEEIERMLEESIDHAEEDIHQRQLKEARVEADVILGATRESLRSNGALLVPGEADRVRTVVAALEAAVRGEDHVAIRDAVDTLGRETEPFARRVMDRSLTEALAQRRLEDI
jgi:molecular chaperone HscA